MNIRTIDDFLFLYDDLFARYLVEYRIILHVLLLGLQLDFGGERFALSLLRRLRLLAIFNRVVLGVRVDEILIERVGVILKQCKEHPVKTVIHLIVSLD